MDIEKPSRKRVRDVLEPFFTCYEEVTLRTPSGTQVRADVVAISTLDCSQPIILAIEVKSHDNTTPSKYKSALYQAYRYVGASINDLKLTALCGQKIDAALVFPAPPYKWHGRISENDGLDYILTGISFFAEQLNVGRLMTSAHRSVILFGANEFWSSNKGWDFHAKNRMPLKGFLTQRDNELRDEV